MSQWWVDALKSGVLSCSNCLEQYKLQNCDSIYYCKECLDLMENNDEKP